MAEQHLWWQTGVVYQIYPRSFMDSNDDGVGDLAGILQRLDYLQRLGVTAIWLSPIFPSPMADFGYDVADYTGIEPLFGTMADFDKLLAEVHQRGMKLILDFVPNHTSNQHPWLVESKSSRDNPKRDWYMWRDAAPDGGVPNNWQSVFGGPAWEWDENTGQYYLHSFATEQPELNWRNPEVEAAMFDAVRFWLDKGVDGFRVDVIFYMIKDALYRDNPTVINDNGVEQQLQLYTYNQPEVHEIVKRLRQLFDQYDDRVIIGEIYLPVEELVRYYGPNADEAHLPFNFQLITLPWNAATIRNAVSEYEKALPATGWPNWVLGNHDQHRIASRVGRAQARVANMLLLTLRGTPTCYYGDEIAMTDVDVPIEQMHDPQEKNNHGQNMGRDPERTPMQWDTSPNAGFTKATPWLPVAPDFAEFNVEVEQADPNSMLNFYHKLMAIRSGSEALLVGNFSEVACDEPDVFAFIREANNARVLVALNFSHEQRVFRLTGDAAQAQVILSTLPEHSGAVDLSALTLEPDEGLILQL